MGSTTLSLKYAKNTGQVLSGAELKGLYFTGLKLQDQDGNPIAQSTIDFYIDAAQTELINMLNIKLSRQAYRENRDYNYDDFVQWGFLQTTYPVVRVLSLQGFLNTVLQITYPLEWLTTKKQFNEEDLYHRKVNVVAIQGSAVSLNNVYIGLSPMIGMLGSKSIPVYWTNTYLTGFEKAPNDIINYIGRLAAISILWLLNDLITGVPTVTQKSISVDGLSQSATSGGFLKKIEAWRKEMDRQLPLIKGRYKGYTLSVLG